jgi:hypothetical protein
VSDTYAVAFTVNGNYAHTALNEHLGDFNTYGGGVSLSVTRDQDILVVRGALSYQYNRMIRGISTIISICSSLGPM